MKTPSRVAEPTRSAPASSAFGADGRRSFSEQKKQLSSVGFGEPLLGSAVVCLTPTCTHVRLAPDSPMRCECRWPHADHALPGRDLSCDDATWRQNLHDAIHHEGLGIGLCKDEVKGFREALPLLFAREAALA